MNTHLKPCPFCAGSDLKVVELLLDKEVGFYAKAVFCNDCHCTGRHAVRSGWSETDQEAIEVWNNRPVADAQQTLSHPDEKKEFDGVHLSFGLVGLSMGLTIGGMLHGL